MGKRLNDGGQQWYLDCADRVAISNRMKATRIVIAVGGFAGLSAATYLDKTLARRKDTESALLNEDKA